jgi:hypothetical protein
MKTATVTELKKELKTRSQEDLVEICLKLSKFKKENKELLTYLLYEAENEQLYIANVKQEIELQFLEINRKTPYFIKKSVRKISRNTKKYIRYSKQKETEVELLIYFCVILKDMKPPISRDSVLTNIFQRQIEVITKKVNALHQDLQFDYERELEELNDL